MRRISRIDRSIGLLRRQSNTRIPSPYLCLTCKHQTSAFSTSTLRRATSDEKAPFTEKVRRRIWGTDKPPGLADPYGDTSVFDRTKQRAREHQEEARSQELEEPPKEVEGSVSDDAVYTGGYEPATSWTELQWVGGDPVWQPEEAFWGFLPARATTDPEKITAALHRAMVEVFVMQQAGKQLYELSNTFPAYQSMNDWTDDVQITPSPSGATLQFAEDISLQQVMEAAESYVKNEEPVEPTESQEDIDADRSEVDPLKDEVIPSTEHHPENTEPTESEEDINADRSTEDPLHRVETKTYHDVISSWDPAWLQVSLQNPEVKFAVLKRTMQLTGIRFPDAAIKSASTAEALLTHLVIPPKPRKLVEALAQNPDLLELENVKIYPAKRSFYDKEREIGRLKVIEKELEARGLDL